MRLARSAFGILLAMLMAAVVAACAGGPVASSPAPAASASTAPSASSTPGASDAGGGSASSGPGGTGGAVSGNPGAGVTPGPVAPPVGPGQSPGKPLSPKPTEVRPVRGLLGIHDVPASEVRAAMSGDHLVATVSWWSGPPPCSDLAEVNVARAGTTFTLTLREGAAQLGIACPALAMYKATTVDLGPVAQGTYDVKAFGVDAPAVVLYAG